MRSNRQQAGAFLVTLAAILGLCLGLFAAPASAVVIINELDCDQTGTDTQEFIELYDGGVGNTDLTGMVIVWFNGSDDLSYRSIDLDGFSTNGSGYFLLGNSGVTPAPSITWPDNLLQNGSDAVALYQANASDFPNGSAITTTNLIDAIVYETGDADDPALLVLLNAAQPQVDENALGSPTTQSNQRCPNGSGGARNTTTYTQATPTPLNQNSCGGDPTGACCFPLGTCTVLTAVDCSFQGGTYQGDDDPCIPNPCPQPTGACCNGITCTVETQVACVAVMGRTWLGPLTTCSPNNCAGACCDGGGATCTLRTESDCLQQGGGGIFLGNGTTCAGGTCPRDYSGILLNEIRTQMSGSDTEEYFEIVGAPGKDLSGLSLVVIGDVNGGPANQPNNSGTVEEIVPLNGESIPADGHFLACEDTMTITPLAQADLVLVGGDLNFEDGESSGRDNKTFLLVAGFSGALADDLDTPDGDCLLNTTPWIQEIDRLAFVVEDNIPSITECHYGTSFDNAIGPDGSFSPSHAFRIPDASLPWKFANQFNITQADDTPGAVNAYSTGACCEGDFCSILTREECVDFFGGIWKGKNVPCAANTCLGACCICTNPPACSTFTCDFTDPVNCDSQGGVFQGDGTVCPPTVGGVDCAQCLTLAQARALPVNTGVRICNVTVASKTNLINTSSSRNFQIQDGSGTDGRTGLTVFGSTALIESEFGNQISGVLPGDVIDIQGTIIEFGGVTELSNGIRALALSRVDSTGGPAPTAIEVQGADFQPQSTTAEALESELVYLDCAMFLDTGNFEVLSYTVAANDGNLITVRISTDQLDIWNTAIPTTPVKLTGVFYQNDGAAPFDQGYQLLVRKLADVEAASCGPTAACCLAGATCRDDLDAGLCAAQGGDFRPGNSCPPTPPCLDNDNVRINEIRVDQPGTQDDPDEYFELVGTPNTPLGNLTYIVLGDGVGGSGIIEDIITLTGESIPADGVFFAAKDTYSLAGTPDLVTPGIGFENADNVTHLLVEGFDDENFGTGDDLDTPDDGVLDITPWTAVIDQVAIIMEPNPPTETEYYYGSTTVGPDGTTSPSHVARCPDGTGGWIVKSADPEVGDDTPGESNPPVCEGCADCLGDLAVNGIINGLDIDPFIDAVLSSSDDGCADMNLDGYVDTLDIPIFANTVLIGAPCSLPTTANTRIVSYNLLNYTSPMDPGRRTAFKRLMNYLNPDVLIAQEVVGSSGGQTDFLNNVLNAADGPGGYALAEFTNGPDSDNALYYRTAKIDYTNGNHVVLSTALRNIDRWKLSHDGQGANGEFYVYSVHLRAGEGQANVDARAAETLILRNDANTLGAGTQFLVAGDMNFYNSNLDDSGNGKPAETGWANLTNASAGAPPSGIGQVVDPIATPGIWSENGVFDLIHTQSPFLDNAGAPGGAAPGGMDDRFDFILISSGLNDAVNLGYVAGSYRAFPNDGNHFNLDINDLPPIPEGTNIANSVHAASDHLPVVMEIRFFP